MVADCGATLAKYILCLWNFSLFIVGAAVLTLGTWLAIDKSSFLEIIQSSKFGQLQSQLSGEQKIIINELTEPTIIEHGAYILIACGSFIFIVALLGYCGAIKESRVLLTAYALFILIIVGLQIAAIVLLIVYRMSVIEKGREFFKDTLEKYYTVEDRSDSVTVVWNFIMTELHCCGLRSGDDFQYASEFMKYTKQQGQGQVIPYSCCKLQPFTSASQNIKSSSLEEILSNDGVIFDNENQQILNGEEDSSQAIHNKYQYIPLDPKCIFQPNSVNSYYNDGCYDAMYEYWISSQNIVIGVAIAVLTLQIFDAIFAFCLCRAVSIDDESSRREEATGADYNRYYYNHPNPNQNYYQRGSRNYPTEEYPMEENPHYPNHQHQNINQYGNKQSSRYYN